MSKINWFITDHNITVNYDGQTHTVATNAPLAKDLIRAIKEERKEDIPALVSAATRIEKFSGGKFKVVDSEIIIDGKPAPMMLGKKILSFSEQNLPYQPLVEFAKNLRLNPSFRAVNELFQFLEKNDHPLTEDGCFIAYKRVASDFKDIHSKTMDNSVGNTVEMPRNEVNEDPTQTCSYGLHVANWDYAYNHYGSGQGVMLEVKVNPADVVAVPIDYDQAKMRVCKYVVLGVVDHEHSTGTQLRDTGTLASDTGTLASSATIVNPCGDCNCQCKDEEYGDYEDGGGDCDCGDCRCNQSYEDDDDYPYESEFDDDEYDDDEYEDEFY